MAEALPGLSDSPDLSVVLFNLDSSDSKVGAKDRQHCMREILDSVLCENLLSPHPLFLLCQDKINNPKHKILCEKMGQKAKSVRCRTEAGVYHRPDLTKKNFLVSYVDVKTLQKTDDRLGLEPDNPFTVARLTACVLTLTCSGGKKILLVSWHGPYKIKPKPRCFHRLIRFSERLKLKEKCDAVIIGGDFNLPADIARREMKSLQKQGEVDGTVLDSYTPPADRQDQDTIDYIVCWPQMQLELLECFVVRPDFRREKGNRPFDHPIVQYKFGLGTQKRPSKQSEE